MQTRKRKEGQSVSAKARKNAAVKRQLNAVHRTSIHQPGMFKNNVIISS